MTEVMSQFRLSSGMPFGMLFILVFLVSLSTIGLIAAVRMRRMGHRVAAAAVALLAGGRLALGIMSEVLVPVDFNPVVRRAELVGSWKDGAQRLLLRADNTFEFQGPSTIRGRWALDDWNLSLDTINARVIQANGAYRIVVSFPGDADEWDGRLGFAREAAR